MSMRFFSSRLIRLLLLCLFPLFAFQPVLADLDVNIFPGTPLDWITRKPRPIPDPDPDPVVSPVPEDEELPDNKRSVVDDRINLDSLVEELKLDILRDSNPILACGITTEDAMGHTAWALATQTSFKTGMTWPQVYTIYAHYLRLFLYKTKKLSLYETTALLHYIGFPSCCHGVHPSIWNKENPIKEAIVPENDSEIKYNLPPDVDTRQKMLYEVVANDLNEGHWYFNDRRFVPYVKLLSRDSKEIQDILLDLANSSPNCFVRRNAAGLVGDIRNDKTIKFLVKKAKGNDIVMRNRALMALTDIKYTDIVPWLIKELGKNPDPYYRSVLIYALGGIQDPAAIEPLTDLAITIFKMPEVEQMELCWSLLPALTRLRAKNDNALEFYKNCLRRFPFKSAFHQMAILGAAVAGSEEEMEKIKKCFPAKGNPLRGFLPGAQALAFEVLVWTDLLDSERDFLSDMITNNDISEHFRLEALRLKKITKDDVGLLKSWMANKKMPPAIKGRILAKWAEVDLPGAAEPAKQIVNRYVKTKPMKATSAAAVPIALKILMSQKKLDEKLLLKVLKHSFAALCHAYTEEIRGPRWVYEPPLPPPVFDLAVEYGIVGRSKKCIAFLLDCIQKNTNEFAWPIIIWNFRRIHYSKSVHCLIGLLDERDPRLRFLAADSLQHLSKQQFDCNWMAADKESLKIHKKGIAFWKKWEGEAFRKK